MRPNATSCSSSKIPTVKRLFRIASWADFRGILAPHFCANAAECEFDKQGRIGIPQELKSYAGIEKELVTMGAMSKIEIWAKDIWEAPDNENRMESEDFAKALAAYNF